MCLLSFFDPSVPIDKNQKFCLHGDTCLITFVFIRNWYKNDTEMIPYKWCDTEIFLHQNLAGLPRSYQPPMSIIPSFAKKCLMKRWYEKYMDVLVIFVCVIVPEGGGGRCECGTYQCDCASWSHLLECDCGWGPASVRWVRIGIVSFNLLLIENRLD